MTPARKILLTILALAVVGAAASAVAGAKMKSERISNRVCETTGGGRFVGIPGFPGERIDRRLLRDVKWMIRKYKIYITDGFSTDPVHSANGEHPVGLALDIVPNRAAGGRWRDLGRLARWAEPRQNQPRSPFRWVGYNGDANHGRGHHLHLSWSHSPSKFGKPARTVYSVRCPRKPGNKPAPTPEPPAEKPDKKPDQKGNAGGGIAPGKGKRGEGGRDKSSGGVNLRGVRRTLRKQRNHPASRERAGVAVRGH